MWPQIPNSRVRVGWGELEVGAVGVNVQTAELGDQLRSVQNEPEWLKGARAAGRGASRP